MKKSKSQAAMEFLMTYGWALLVVLIVIAALAFFGLLNPERFLPEKCEIAPGITCVDFNAVSSEEDAGGGPEQSTIPMTAVNNIAVSGLGFRESITILLKNGIGTTMYDVMINATDCTSPNTLGATAGVGTLGSPSQGDENFQMSNGTKTIAPGDTATFVIGEKSVLTGLNPANPHDDVCWSLVPGGRFTTDLIVNYTTRIDGTTLTHVKKGYLSVEVDQITCGNTC